MDIAQVSLLNVLIDYNIETKTSPAGDGKLHPAPAEFVPPLLAVIKAKDVQDRVII